MQYHSIPIEVNEKIQLFRFFMGDEFYIWSEGLELAMDNEMKVFYCDMPDNWVILAMEKLRLLIKVSGFKAL